jgi:hypothetical protein
LKAAGIDDAWVSSAVRCGYCGCVYSISANGVKMERGYFEGDLIENGRWRPF